MILIYRIHGKMAKKIQPCDITQQLPTLWYYTTTSHPDQTNTMMNRIPTPKTGFVDIGEFPLYEYPKHNPMTGITASCHP